MSNQRHNTAVHRLDLKLIDELQPAVDALLADRHAVARALRAFAAEFSSAKFSRRLTEVADALETTTDAATLLSRPDRIEVLLPWMSQHRGPVEAGASLHALLRESQRIEAVRRARRRVLAYPAAVGLLLLPVLIFLLIVVVPVYGEIFTAFSFELPLLTAVFVRLSEWMMVSPWVFWPALVAVLAVVCVGYLLLIQARRWYYLAFGYVMNGSSHELLVMAAFIRRLRGALLAGLSVPAAVDLAGQLTPFRDLGPAAAQLAVEIEGSAPLDQTQAAARFPASLLWVLDRLRVREAPGSDGDGQFLDALSENYLECVAQRIDWNTGILGHAAIVAVGALVGLFLIATMLPFVQLLNGLGDF